MGEERTVFEFPKSHDFRIIVAGKPIEVECAKLTVNDDDDGSTKDIPNGAWQQPYTNKSWKCKCTGIVGKVDDTIKEMFNKTSDEIEAMIFEKPGKMPRKMKKAYKADYRRNTKWRRKAGNYILRKTFHAKHAELILTKEQRTRLAILMKFDTMEPGFNSITFRGNSLRDLIKRFFK